MGRGHGCSSLSFSLPRSFGLSNGQLKNKRALQIRFWGYLIGDKPSWITLPETYFPADSRRIPPKFFFSFFFLWLR